MTMKKRGIWKCIIFSVIAIFGFLMFLYTDVAETTRHGINVWVTLDKGCFRDFYQYNVNSTMGNNMGNSVVCTYDFPIFIIFAVWNLPLFIYEKVTGLYALDTMLGVLWAKSIILPFLMGTIGVMIKIGKKLRKDFDAKEFYSLFLSSALFFVPIVIMGQYDIIMLFFIMLGILAYMEDDIKKFVLYFAIANVFKMFAIFIFIPLVLFREKKLVKAILNIVLGMVPLLLCKIIQSFYFTKSEEGTEFVAGHLLSFIFQGQMGLVYGSVSLFVLAMVVFCTYTYMKKTPSNKDMPRWTLYISLIGFSIFFITCQTHPQWIILLLPFLILLIMSFETEQERKIGICLETILSIGILMSDFIFYYWVFNVKTSVFTLAGKLFYNGEKDWNYSIKDWISGVLPNIDINYINLAGGGLFVAGLLFFIFWSYPKRKQDRFAEVEIPSELLYVVRGIVILMTYGMLINLLR